MLMFHAFMLNRHWMKSGLGQVSVRSRSGLGQVSVRIRSGANNYRILTECCPTPHRQLTESCCLEVARVSVGWAIRRAPFLASVRVVISPNAYPPLVRRGHRREAFGVLQHGLELFGAHELR